MLKTVRTYIDTHALLQKGDRVLVALSGGADSVCLLHVLRQIGYECVVAHCNFHLRDEESMRDEHFVRQLCEKCGIELRVKDFDTIAYANSNGISIEMAARELRYAWFEELRSQTNCAAIAVAHHKNDQAETLLLNLKRGTGIRGLCGMRPRNGKVVRPLLCISRKQIEDYARANDIAFVYDSSNSDPTIRRNAIRAILQGANEAEIEHMAHTADLMQAYDKLLGALLLGRDIPTESEEVLFYELLAPYGFNPTQVRNALSALDGSGKKFEAPSYTAYVDHGQLTICSRLNTVEQQPPTLLRAIFPKLNRIVYPAAHESEAMFDADLLPSNLTLRHWKEGDFFYPITSHAKAGKKKLQDFFSDQHLSVQEKDKIWLLAAGDVIVWIVGYRIDNRFKISEKTTRIAHFSIEN